MSVKNGVFRRAQGKTFGFINDKGIRVFVAPTLAAALSDGDAVEFETEQDPSRPNGWRATIVTPLRKLAPKPAATLNQPVAVASPTPAVPKAHPAGPFDDNPYNFVEWDGSQPWPREAGPCTHDAHHEGRYSGVIDVTLEAVTPVFVPHAARDGTGAPQTFWRCKDASGAERLGIPGSSIKGALRCLFESWTNSHLGVVSEPDYAHPIPYRRRCVQGWVVVGPHSRGGLAVAGCDLVFCRSSSAGWERRGATAHGDPVPWDENPTRVQTLNPANADWQVIPLRANLLWTSNHRHTRWTHVAVRIGATLARLSPEAVERFRANLGEPDSPRPAFAHHADRVTELPPSRNYYTNVRGEPLPQRIRELRDLAPGTLLLGPRAHHGEVPCFGKNVNFLWPSDVSPRALLGSFARKGDVLQIGDADAAEATFGFAAAHGDDPHSHPFRARIRPTTFWAAQGVTEMPPVQLGPLTSPTGLKLKARPVYLKPGPNGRSATYDENPALRGRKHYWHQRWEGEGPVVGDHRPQQGDAPTQLPPRLRPVPPGSRFQGEIHFDNLTSAELGALLVTVCPDLYWKARGRYGIKVGKAKPRGWGSVVAKDMTLRVRVIDSSSYGSLDASTLAAASVESHVDVLRAWLRRGGPEPGFVEDLERLLRLPTKTWMKKYQGPGTYGWMPGVDVAAGDGNRPVAMPLARWVVVP